MHSLNRFHRASVLASRGAVDFRPGTRINWRAHLCSAALLAADPLGFTIATFLAFALDVSPKPQPYTRAIENLTVLGAEWHGWGSLLVLVTLLTYFASRGHYTARVPTWTQFGDIVVATAVALAADIFLTVAVYQRPIMLEGLLRWVLFCPCVLLLRTGLRYGLRAADLWTVRTLIIAAAGEVDAAKAALLSDPALGYAVVGTVTPLTAATLPEIELSEMVTEQGADMVVMAVGAGNPAAERTVLNALRLAGVPIALVPTLQGVPVVGFRPHYFLGHDIVMLVGPSNLTRPFSRAVKAVFDLVAALMLLVLLMPLLLTLAVLVAADGGPALYRHRRIGQGGRPFDCLKFRSMRPDADAVLRRLLAADAAAAAEWAATQKLRRDPRVTRIGRFLRRTSLDELPQLFNVLRGEMSLVGPRPIVHAEIERYGSDIEYYNAAKPGITGLWQVSGRSDTTYAGRVRLDVWYVRNWTLWHDIAIILKTIPAVFLQRGAL